MATRVIADDEKCLKAANSRTWSPNARTLAVVDTPGTLGPSVRLDQHTKRPVRYNVCFSKIFFYVSARTRVNVCARTREISAF